MYQFGLIGHPVQNSQSPEIHQYFLNTVGLKGTYQLFDVLEEELEEFLYKLRNSNLIGVNVTVPYKEKVIPFLDEIDDQAKNLKSVNTIKRNGNRLIGYNTDGEGYYESLKQAFPSFHKQFNEQSILILGAGGAAKGIYYSLEKRSPKQIDIANRSIARAEKIVSMKSNSKALMLGEAELFLAQYDLIIQTTTVGMEPNGHEQIINLDHLKKDTIVSDIVYKPKWTKFLSDAQKRGSELLFGESMLWHQAAKSFEIWTGKSVEHSIQIRQ